MTSGAFGGFERGGEPPIPVPEAFFSRLLPEMDNLCELRVTLHLFWLLARKRGTPRCCAEGELLADPLLLETVRVPGSPRPPEDLVREGLDRAIARGTALRFIVRVGDERERWYVLNTPNGREAVRQLTSGEDNVGELIERVAGPGRAGVEIERPSIFVLYEQQVGMLTPMMSDVLRDAEQRYPPEWVAEAFKLAARQNVRSWSYVEAILERWTREGKDHGTPERRTGSPADRAARADRRLGPD